MGFFQSKKGSIISDNFLLLETVGQFNKGLAIEVALYEESLQLSAPFMKLPEVTLKYSQITDVFYGLRTEITEKTKSPIGRAIAGGVLFGGVGAIVGAVSGTGKKEKKESKFFFIVSYTSTSGEEKLLQFEDTRLYKGRKLANKLKELCGIKEAAPITEL